MKVKVKQLQDCLLDIQRKVEDGHMTYHSQQLIISKILEEWGIPKDVVWKEFQAARDKVTRRHASDKELMDCITWKSNGRPSGRPYEKADPDVTRNQQAIDTWTSRGNIDDLISTSDEIPDDPKKIIEDFFYEHDYLFITDDVCRGEILSAGDWVYEKDLDNMQYICQSVLRDPQAGRNNANVEKQRYYVFESDELPKMWDEQAGLIVRLSQELPLRLVVYSGNKSLHAYFDGSVNRKDKVKRWFEVAKTLGGDSQVLDKRCQLVRFPLGFNSKTKEKQKVIFYRKPTHG